MNFKTTVERELKKVPSSIPSVYVDKPITTYHFTAEEFEQAMTNAALAVVEEVIAIIYRNVPYVTGDQERMVAELEALKSTLTKE